MPYVVKCLLCENDANNVKDGTQFFRVPADVNVRERWQNALQRKKLSSRNFICSKHFKSDDLQCVSGQIFLGKHALPIHPDEKESHLQSDLITMPMINLQIDRNSSDEESTAESVVSPMRTERFVAPEESLKYISRIPIFHLQTVQCGEYGKPIQAPLKDTISQGIQTSIDDVPSFAPKSITTQIPDSQDMEYFNPEETLIQQSNEANSTIQDLNELLKEKNASIQSLQNKILRQTRKINHLIKIIGNLRRAGFRYNVAPLLGNNCSPSNGLKSAVREINQNVPPEVEPIKTDHPVVSKATVAAQKAHGPALPRIQTRSKSISHSKQAERSKR